MGHGSCGHLVMVLAATSPLASAVPSWAVTELLEPGGQFGGVVPLGPTQMSVSAVE